MVSSLKLSTLRLAPPFTFGFLAAVGDHSAIWAVFRPVRTGDKHGPALTAPFTLLAMEQSRFHLPVQRQDSGPKVFADQGTGNTLNADAWLPAVVQQQAVPIVIIAAFMHQPLDGAELLIGQMWYCFFAAKRAVYLTQTALRHKIIQFGPPPAFSFPRSVGCIPAAFPASSAASPVPPVPPASVPAGEHRTCR